MRVLIQNKRSGLFFKDVGVWVQGKAEARDLITAPAAIEFCLVNKFKDALIVYAFEDPAFDIAYTMPPTGEPSPVDAPTPQHRDPN